MTFGRKSPKKSKKTGPSMQTIRNNYPKTIRYPSFCGEVSETGIRYPRETHGWELYTSRRSALSDFKKDEI